MAQDANARFQEGIRLQNAGQLDEARRIFLTLAEALPTETPIHTRLGQVAFALGKMEDAASHFEAALRCNPEQADILSNLGVVYRRIERLDESLAAYEKALEHNPDSADTLFNQGVVLQSMERFEEAEKAFRQAIQIDAAHPSARFHLGNLLMQMESFEEAVVCYQETIHANIKVADSYCNMGSALKQLNRHDEARVCYEKAAALNPESLDTLYNLGNLLCQQGRLNEAAVAYDRCLRLDPKHLPSLGNYGNVLTKLQRYDDAEKIFDRALVEDPKSHSVTLNRGNVYYIQKSYPAALAAYERALEIDPEYKFQRGQLIYTKLHAGDWAGFDNLATDLIRDVMAGKPVSTPFAILSLVDDPQVQQRAIETFAKTEFPTQNALPLAITHPEHSRIRIGYFSTDYYHHPVTHLMLGLFNAHDRSRFEVIAFSLGNPIKDKWHQRVKESVDQFIEVQDLSDKEVAELARSMEIDIAVDLNGFTEHCRAGIFAHRAAPVQVSYIGYLGTMGAPYIDYLVTDTTIVPPEARPFYNEKMIYLPSYQINDPEQRPSERPMSRAEFGLPDDAFVFCAFNNNYKITPSVFECWMRILNRAPNAVLWLFVSNEQAQENLRQFAAEHGVAPERLIFAKKIVLEDHLARQRLGDLFLDTLPYNAGATASNALRVGLPVLTRTGKSFAGRMGSSLLKAVGLPELITATPQEYEDKAVQLASDPVLIQSIRQKLAANLPNSALFDNKAFARNIETAFQTVHNRACQGLPPMHVLVKD